MRGEDLDSIGMLERLLRCTADEAHQHMAALLWDRCAPPLILPSSDRDNSRATSGGLISSTWIPSNTDCTL